MKWTQRGFTIIEMLLVISILAFLAAIIIPRFNDFTSTAQEAARSQQAAIINTKIHEYYDEFGYYPSHMGKWGWAGDGPGVARSLDTSKRYWPDGTNGTPPASPDGVGWNMTRHNHATDGMKQLTFVK